MKLIDQRKSSGRLDYLIHATWKKRETIRRYFQRNGLSILSNEDIDFYLDKFKKDETN